LWRDLQGDYVVTRIEQKFNSSAEWRFTVRGTLDWMQWGVTLADYSGGFVGDYAAFRTSGRHHWIVMNFDNPASPIPTSQQFTIFGHP
jgi:hypothetical protein